MTFVDLGIISIIGILLVLGVVWGFLRVTVMLASWVSAIIIAINFAPNLSASLLKSTIDSAALRLAVAMAILFIITLMLGALVNFLLRQIAGKAGLTGLDRVLGLILGTALGMLIILVAVFFAGLTPIPKYNWWQSSLLLGYFEIMVRWVVDFLPADLAKYFSY
jgi:membrane protein required for colicin V production